MCVLQLNLKKMHFNFSTKRTRERYCTEPTEIQGYLTKLVYSREMGV